MLVIVSKRIEAAHKSRTSRVRYFPVLEESLQAVQQKCPLALSRPAPTSPKCRRQLRGISRIPFATAPALFDAYEPPTPAVRLQQRVVAEKLMMAGMYRTSGPAVLASPVEHACLVDADLFRKLPFWSIFRPRRLVRMWSSTNWGCVGTRITRPVL